MQTSSLRVSLLLLTSISPAVAQWLSYPNAWTPRSKDGEPNLSAPVPRINGKPDLSGVWQAERTPVSEFRRILGDDAVNLQVDINDITKHVLDIFWGVKNKQEFFRPETLALLKERATMEFGTSRCLPAGIPAALFVLDFKIVQTPREIVMLMEDGDPPRQIHTDGRDLPQDTPQPAWMGYSVARWEGNILAVETTGFNEDSWLDMFGHPRSQSMRIRERYHRRDFGHMDLEVTIEDPKYYTKPYTFSTQLNLIPYGDVLEYVCNEGLNYSTKH